MAREEKKVSEIVDALPRYIMKKEKINFSDDLGGLYEKLKIGFADGIVDTLDGVRFDFTDSSWIQIRPSNTEPIVRIIGEAKTPERLEELFAKARLTLGLK
jgi:phosphomannomutase